jgi:hypothetical protein
VFSHIDGKASAFQQDAAKKFVDFVMTTDAVSIMVKSNTGDSLFWPTLLGRSTFSRQLQQCLLFPSGNCADR